MKVSLKNGIFAGIVLLIVILAVFFFLRSQTQDVTQKAGGKIDIKSMISDITKSQSDIVLTIGILKSDQTNYKVFGVNSTELKSVEYDYEIGSISKTFTTALLCKAINEGKIELQTPISTYLPLNSAAFYPTILSLATHTSGYGDYPFDAATLSTKQQKMIESIFYKERKNIYRGINRSSILNDINSHILKNRSYDFEYSNFGIAVLGTALGEVYKTTYPLLVKDFIDKELGLTKTRIGDGTGNFDRYWEWNSDDVYIASGGIVSTVTDLLLYAKMHLNNTPGYLALSHSPHYTSPKDGIQMGLGWIIDPETGYHWHNGGTSSFTSFLGIDHQHNTAVVILSNIPAQADADNDKLDVLGYAILGRLGDSKSDILTVLE